MKDIIILTLIVVIPAIIVCIIPEDINVRILIGIHKFLRRH